MPELGALAQNAGPLGTAAEKAAWAAMDRKARSDVSRVFSNIGKVIAACEKTLTHGESRFDRYVEGTVSGNPGAQQILSPQEVNGLRFMDTGNRAMQGTFKTPGLRNVAMRPPYMHAGQFSSLDEVITHYMKAPAAVVGNTELANGGNRQPQRTPIRLSEKVIKELALFLGTLTGSIVETTNR